LPQVDLREAEVELGRTIRGRPGDIFSQLLFSAFARYAADHDGQVTNRAVALGATYEGPLQSAVEVGVALGDEFFAGQLFSLYAYWLNSRLRPSGALAMDLSGSGGTTIDLANVRKADVLNVAPSITWLAGRRVNLRFSHDFERLSFEGERISVANLSQVRLQYHFKRSTKTLFAQLLFSLKLNPRTVVFVGYSDNRRGLTDTSLIQTDRTFFVKLGYAWRP
jgi:hypothetical protein